MKRSARWLLIVGVTSLLAVAPSAARAQTAPPPPPESPSSSPPEAPPPPPDAPPPPPPPPDGVSLQCPSCEPGPDDRRAIDAAIDLMANGRADAARQVLQPRLTGVSPWGRSYTSLAVLDRLATRMAATSSGAADPEAPSVDEVNQPRGSLEAVSLYASAITLGLGTGVWLDVMFEVDDVRAAVSIPLLLGGVGAGALYLAERSSGPIRRGRGTAMSNGFVLGLTAGTLLGVYGGNELRWKARGVATTIWAGAVLGGGLGYVLGAVAESRPASASFVGSGGLWGAVLGLTAAGLVDLDSDAIPIAGLVGEVVGAGAAAALTGILRPAESQVRWMDLGVFSGGLVGVGLSVLVFADSVDDSLIGPALVVQAGMIGGGVLGYVLGRPTPTAGASGRSTAARDRFAMTPSIGPTPGGAQVLLSLPNLL
ncbi:MAG: hypothetical protein Q8S73_45375 [Deltaproteobacteria bacterium]|nr:hypothetical protein [Myxococcales bacterium]MDP3221401.1 hypothetical protein [Deltaproteobacteria bacterium]